MKRIKAGKKKSWSSVFYSPGMLLMLLLAGICLKNTVLVKAAGTEKLLPKTETEIMEEIKSHRDCIVRIESLCWDGEEKIYDTKSFSGFVVTNDNSGIYVVTTNHNLEYTLSEYEALKSVHELENNARLSEKIEVVFNGDVRIPASIVGESEQRDLTVLKLNQKVNFENIFQFVKEDVSAAERIFLLSYPEPANYSIENVNIASGNISSIYLIDELLFMKHNIRSGEGSLGGPLVNEDGFVVGMLLTVQAEEEGTAVSAQVIKEFLDTFDVGYAQYEEVEEKKKVPVLQIILGIVIVILAFFVMKQVLKGRRNQEPKADRYQRQTVREEEAVSSVKKSSVVKAVLEYPAEKRTVFIRKAVFVIGRAQESDFVMSDSSGISRKHACIQYEGRNFHITDLNSTNHTFLNGLELTPGERRSLKNGDQIMVGKEKMYFYIK